MAKLYFDSKGYYAPLQNRKGLSNHIPFSPDHYDNICYRDMGKKYRITVLGGLKTGYGTIQPQGMRFYPVAVYDKSSKQDLPKYMVSFMLPEDHPAVSEPDILLKHAAQQVIVDAEKDLNHMLGAGDAISDYRYNEGSDVVYNQEVYKWHRTADAPEGDTDIVVKDGLVYSEYEYQIWDDAMHSYDEHMDEPMFDTGCTEVVVNIDNEYVARMFGTNNGRDVRVALYSRQDGLVGDFLTGTGYSMLECLEEITDRSDLMSDICSSAAELDRELDISGYAAVRTAQAGDHSMKRDTFMDSYLKTADVQYAHDYFLKETDAILQVPTIFHDIDPGNGKFIHVPLSDGYFLDIRGMSFTDLQDMDGTTGVATVKDGSYSEITMRDKDFEPVGEPCCLYIPYSDDYINHPEDMDMATGKDVHIDERVMVPLAITAMVENMNKLGTRMFDGSDYFLMGYFYEIKKSELFKHNDVDIVYGSKDEVLSQCRLPEKAKRPMPNYDKMVGMTERQDDQDDILKDKGLGE